MKKNTAPKKPTSMGSTIGVSVLALIFIAAAVISSWEVVDHTQKSTNAIEKILNIYGLKNEAAKTLGNYKQAHPFLGFLISSPVKNAMELPSTEQAQEALGPDVKAAFKTIREESSQAAWWSWFLLSSSLIYVIALIGLERSFTARSVIFGLTLVTLSFFFIGILAPAMVIWTAPTIPLQSGDLDFVVQHQVRGIFAIIWELIIGDHWIIGGFLMLFSVVTPLTKATLTIFITASHSKELNVKLGTFLHAIGKWSMADVFVAAILLALYALKFQQATRSIPCLGLYYFIGYCLLSLTTIELLMHSGEMTRDENKGANRRLGTGVIGGLIAAAVCYLAASSLYTYEQYTENIKETIKATSSPKTLDNANLVLPVHKK